VAEKKLDLLEGAAGEPAELGAGAAQVVWREPQAEPLVVGADGVRAGAEHPERLERPRVVAEHPPVELDRFLGMAGPERKVDRAPVEEQRGPLPVIAGHEVEIGPVEVGDSPRCLTVSTVNFTSCRFAPVRNVSLCCVSTAGPGGSNGSTFLKTSRFLDDRSNRPAAARRSESLNGRAGYGARFTTWKPWR